MTNKTRWQRYSEELQQRVDYMSVYESFGCPAIGHPSPNGWVSCRSPECFGGRDGNPSAGFNIRTGYFKDFRRGGDAISLYDFMVATGHSPDWRAAQAHIASLYAIKPPTISKDHPEHGVVWQAWNDLQAIQYCAAKVPITKDGLIRSGARMCSRYNVPCFAWPIYDHGLQIVGWYFTPRSGAPFQGGAKSIAKKFDGAEAGFIGQPAAEWLSHNMGLTSNNSQNSEDRVVYWTEGVPDMVAGYSRFPDGLFVSNPNGCSENLTATQAAMVDNGNTMLVLVADADVPGLAGAFKRWEQVTASTKWCKAMVMAPPFPVQDKHGQDLRDILASLPHDTVIRADEIYLTDSLLVRQTKPEEIQAIKERERETAARTSDAAKQQAQQFLESIGLHIAACAGGDEITLYSSHTQRVSTIKSIANWKYEDAALLAGTHFLDKVKRKRSDNDHVVIFDTFKDMMILVCSSYTGKEYETLGAGIWPLKDDDGLPTGELILIKSGSCYIVHGSKLERQNKPFFDCQIADCKVRKDWFNEDLLSAYMAAAASPTWRVEVYKRLLKYISTWKWAHKDQDVLVCGLIMSTWLQTLWRWRPIITVVGESSSGKTLFMETLANIYLRAASLSGNSTAAGVKQSILRDGTPLLLDEFDSGSGVEQRKLLQAFRVSSRGQETLQGTPTNGAVQYALRHMPWLAGIFASSTRQADLNRMISLEMLSGATINLPSATECRELGHQILAGVLVTSQSAVVMAEQLSRYRSDSVIPARYRESYSIPYATLAAFLDISVEEIEDIMTEYLRDQVVEQIDELEATNDQEDLLIEIMNSDVRVGSDAPKEYASVAEILYDPEFSSFHKLLQTRGIAVVTHRKTGQRRVCFACHHMTGNSGILWKSKNWAGNPGISQVLRRLSHSLNPLVEKQNVAGQTRHCITLDYKLLRAWLARNLSNGPSVDASARTGLD